MLKKIRERSSTEGFTLIELLIVIVILGILAAIVVFAVGSTTSSAKTNACQADIKTTQTAVEAYAAQNNGAYPGTLTALTSAGTNGGPWLRSVPVDVNYDATTGAVTAKAGVTGGNC